MTDISDRSKRYVSFKATATKNTSTSFMIKAPGSMSVTGGQFQDNLTNDRLVFGGWAWGTDICPGDYIQLDAIDHDNVLGYGADFVLKTFNETATIQTYPTSGTNTVSVYNGILLHPDERTEISNTIPSRLYGGIWLRITYVSVGTITDPTLYVNINWEKLNS